MWCKCYLVRSRAAGIPACTNHQGGSGVHIRCGGGPHATMHRTNAAPVHPILNCCTFTHFGETTSQCQPSVMVQSALIDLDKDNGDAKPFGNLDLRPRQPRRSPSFPVGEIREKINCIYHKVINQSRKQMKKEAGT